MIRALVAFASFAALCACATAPPLDMERPAGAWRLEHLDGAPSGAPRQPTITFEGDRVAGFAGCNQFFAQVEQDPAASAYFGGIGATRMMCHGPSMEMEQVFLGGLARTRAVRVVDGKLVFFGEGESEIMRFTPAPDESAG